MKGAMAVVVTKSKPVEAKVLMLTHPVVLSLMVGANSGVRDLMGGNVQWEDNSAVGKEAGAGVV